MKKLKASKEDSVLFMDEVAKLHHPNSAANSETIVTPEGDYDRSVPYDRCREVYITRTGIVRFALYPHSVWCSDVRLPIA